MVMKCPEMLIDRVAAGETTFQKADIQPPHCDPRVLHAPGECFACDMPKMHFLHKEREKLDVNYTGKKDRSYPCPAERARGLESINKWHGNRPDGAT